MVVKKAYIGTIGPHLYDDERTYDQRLGVTDPGGSEANATDLTPELRVWHPTGKPHVMGQDDLGGEVYDFTTAVLLTRGITKEVAPTVLEAGTFSEGQVHIGEAPMIPTNSLRLGDVTLESLGLLATISGVDLTATDTDNLFSVPATGTTQYLIEAIHIRITAASGYTSPPTVQLKNDSGDIYIPPFPLVGLDAVLETGVLRSMGTILLTSPSDVIQFEVTNAGVATTLTASVDLIARQIQ